MTESYFAVLSHSRGHLHYSWRFDQTSAKEKHLIDLCSLLTSQNASSRNVSRRNRPLRRNKIARISKRMLILYSFSDFFFILSKELVVLCVFALRVLFATLRLIYSFLLGRYRCVCFVFAMLLCVFCRPLYCNLFHVIWLPSSLTL